MSQRTYLSCAETAQLMRAALKESFPGVKFSVVSSRGSGASIDIKWTDGPCQKMVEEVAKTFQGGYFDGMIDYAGSNYHKLDGQPVHFGSKYVFCKREESDEAIEKAIAFLKAKYPSQVGAEATVADYKAGKLYSVQPTGGWSYQHSLQAMIAQAVAKRSSVAGPMPSATLERVQFEGDDGYGQGTVGMPGDTETGTGYPRSKPVAPAEKAAQQVATILIFPKGSEVIQ